MAQSIGYSQLLAHGMFMSSTCAEDVRFIDEDDVRRATAGTFLGDYRVRRQQAACRIWPRGEGVEDGFQAPVRLDVPVLVISGDVDVATPASDGERVAKELPNGRHVVFPGQGHEFTNPRAPRS
ncbi:MAG: alpha/beta hydrolase [Acidobacteria bacterium]|nr:alpha/beta hydrolase [Acidobacteriota bacterium]